MKFISQRLLFLIVAFTICGLILVYPTTRITSLLIPSWTPSLLLTIVLFALPISMRILHERIQRPWSRQVTAVVMTWLGICFIALVLLIPAELILLTGLVNPQWLGTAVALATFLISAYSIFNAQRLRTQVVAINAGDRFRGKRLAQISDVHIGSRQSGFLAPIVDRVNALKPDYALITGDLIDMHGISEQDLAPLANINAPTLFCIGNHERYVDLEDICTRLTNLGIEVLRNSSVQEEHFQFIGIDDAERRDQVARELPTVAPAADTFRILLYHRPDGAQAAADWGVDLMLTGHTHRGQIFPFNFLVKRVFPLLYQNYTVDDMILYVSPGTGTWGPVMRLGSKCEITLFALM